MASRWDPRLQDPAPVRIGLATAKRLPQDLEPRTGHRNTQKSREDRTAATDDARRSLRLEPPTPQRPARVVALVGTPEHRRRFTTTGRHRASRENGRARHDDPQPPVVVAGAEDCRRLAGPRSAAARLALLRRRSGHRQLTTNSTARLGVEPCKPRASRTSCSRPVQRERRKACASAIALSCAS